MVFVSSGILCICVCVFMLVDEGVFICVCAFLIESIYGNVLNISQNTKQAADELTTANRHQKRARKNMCCFMLIITIVGCVLALIIVVAK